MELKKLLVNDKITASYKTDVSQELFQTLQTTKMNFEKLLGYQVFKNHNCSRFQDRRAAACESFMRNLKPSNPVFGLAMSRRVTTVHSYSLRSCGNYNNKMCKTKRLSEFVSVKYLDFLS